MLDPFILKAILGVIFASFSSVVSTLMLLRGALYITPEVSHAALGGAAIGVLIQMFLPGFVDPFLFVILFCIATSVFVSRMGKGGPQALGVMLSVSLAVSVMLYAVIRSYLPIDKRVIVDGYLVSDLLLISNSDLLSLAIASTLAIVVTTLFYRELLYICFDLETAEALGLKVGLYDSLLFAISAVTVAVVAKTVGVLLSVTLLIIPAATSRFLTHSIGRMFVTSFLIALISGLGGVALSFYFNVPTSGAIALVSIVLFASAYLIKARRM
ncbi:metal ABC transporter permease [Candidatus Bathyarchaeota archaeon]|nr:metal ABC transporter permease [Candidatus Bathyarchaeota archaeon]MBS7613745.1 metal ABC transporter permease [Candidatus Bathyarchaeota archaeon]MBS7618438.1 metal ABC transporter permease [Candidatus Bathyarchaeota archaeon]